MLCGDDLEAFEERANKLGLSALIFCCEPKLDGVAMSLYEDGVLLGLPHAVMAPPAKILPITRERWRRYRCDCRWRLSGDASSARRSGHSEGGFPLV